MLYSQHILGIIEEMDLEMTDTLPASKTTAKIAKAANLKVFQVENESQFEKILVKIKKLLGPIMIVVKIKNSKETGGRVQTSPIKIKEYFMQSI